MGRRAWSKLAGLTAGAAVIAGGGVAAASSGIDSPESGVVQAGRGSAWLARADDPLAVYFNPAAMAFQATSVHVGAQLLFESRCFTRLGPNGQPVSPGPGLPAPLLAGQPQPGDGSVVPQDKLCAPATPFPTPQLAAVFRLTRSVAVGLAVVAPHAVGTSSWGQSIPYTNPGGFPIGMPAPSRYLLVSSSSLIVYPTAAVAFAPTENLSFGVGFIWGIGSVDFVTFAESVSTPGTPAMPPTDHFISDVRAELKATDLFIPGVVLSGLWMPTRNLDVAAWFKWQDALKADVDLNLQSLYWLGSGAPNTAANIAAVCTQAMNKNKTTCNVTDIAGAGRINFQIPMEAKLGLRFHYPRAEPTKQPAWASVPGRKVRDPMSEDVFDVEADFTWANNSSAQQLGLTFNPGYPINDGSPGGVGEVPPNGNVPLNWKDVVGVRVGSDVVVLPSVLSLRAGAFYQTKGQDDAYLSLDFDLAQQVGVSGGGTVRLGPIDLSIAYQHTFFGTLNNGGNGKIYALSGYAGGCATTPAGQPGCYRSYQPVNGGILTASLNEVGLAATARF